MSTAGWDRRIEQQNIERSNYWGELGIWSTRRLGEVLRDMPKQRPGEYKRLHDATVSPSLEALGILKNQSARAQRLAALPEKAIRQYVAESQGAGEEVTRAGLLRHVAAERQAAKHAEVQDAVETIAGQSAGEIRGTYRTIVIDPPWPMKKIMGMGLPWFAKRARAGRTPNPSTPFPTPSSCCKATWECCWHRKRPNSLENAAAVAKKGAHPLRTLCTETLSPPTGRSPSQAAVAEAKRAKLSAEYAAEVERMKGEAAGRKKATLKRGQKKPDPVGQQVTQRADHPTSTTRARAVGTNRRYLEAAEELLESDVGQHDTGEHAHVVDPRARTGGTLDSPFPRKYRTPLRRVGSPYKRSSLKRCLDSSSPF